MAHTLTCYSNFSKKRNSTKQPSGGRDFSVTPKWDECSLYNPIFVINESSSTMIGYNYCKFENRYYYITDVKFVANSVCEISATFDALATYKSAIGTYDGYISRTSNSSQYKKILPDNILTPYGLNGAYNEQWSTGFDYSQNYTMLASYGTNGAEYNMIKDTPENITASLMGNITDLWSAVYQKLTTPAEYIKAMKLFPWYPNSLDLGTLVKLGNAASVDFESNARPLLASDRNATKNFSLPLSTLKANLLYANDDYRRYDNDFTIIGMNLPFAGYIALDSWILNYLYINITYTIDFWTGNGQVVVYASLASIGDGQTANNVGGKQIYFGNVQFGIEIPIVTFYSNRSNFQNNIADVSLNPLKMIDNTLKRGYNPTKNISQTGCLDGMGINDLGHIRLFATQKDSLSRDNYVNEKGFPSEAKGTPASGHYYEYYNPSISLDGRAEDISEVNGYLSNGFYYE